MGKDFLSEKNLQKITYFNLTHDFKNDLFDEYFYHASLHWKTDI